MERTEFDQVVIFLQGAYQRSFPEQAVTVAWGIFQNLDASLVMRGAVKMVESGEEFPSPMKWLKHVKELQAEGRHERARVETTERIDRLLTGSSGGTPVSRQARDEIREILNRPYPEGHILAPRRG